MKNTVLFLLVILLWTPLFLSAQQQSAQQQSDRQTAGLPELAEHHGRNYLLLILAVDRNETRVFDLHLDLAIRWDQIERRRIVPVDILPPRRDVRALARWLGVEDNDFAVVLLNKEGEVIFRATDTDVIPSILEIVDRDSR